MFVMFFCQQTEQAEQVHRGPKGKVHAAGPAGCGSSREAQTHQEQDQETAEAAGKGYREGVLLTVRSGVCHNYTRFSNFNLA